MHNAKENDIKYIENVSKLKFGSNVISEIYSEEFDFFLKKKYTIKNIDQFYNINKDRILQLKADSANNQLECPDMINRINCIRGREKKLAWMFNIIPDSSLLYVEVWFPDFSGQ